MTRFLWPVTDDPFTMRPLVIFFTSADATDFALSERLYLGEPRYDHRTSGYRPAEKPSGYREWLASLEPKELPNGRFQVAA